MEKEEYIEKLMRLNPEPFHGREWAEQDWLNYQAHLEWCDKRVNAGLPIGKEYDGIDETLDRGSFGYH